MPSARRSASWRWRWAAMSERVLRFDDLQHVRPGTDHRLDGDGLVERGQAAAHVVRQAHQVDVGQLTVALDERHVKQFRVPQRDGIIPGVMSLVGTEAAEQRHERGQTKVGVVGRIAQYPQEPIFRDGTGGLGFRAFVCEPVVRQVVMNVIGVEERDQDIHVEKADLHDGSSRSRFTNAIVGRGAPAGRLGRRGTPLRVRPEGGADSAFLRSSETTWPAVRPWAAANSFAASRTSSSRSRVVRTPKIVTHHASDVKGGGGINNDASFVSGSSGSA